MEEIMNNQDTTRQFLLKIRERIKGDETLTKRQINTDLIEIHIMLYDKLAHTEKKVNRLYLGILILLIAILGTSGNGDISELLKALILP
jgi:hypothetical protein